MENFYPPEEFFKPVLFNCYWYLPGEFERKLERNTLKSIIDTVNNYYGNAFSLDIGFAYHTIFQEILKNARVHGGNLEGKPTYCGIFLNKENFCFGCNDGGVILKI